MGPVHFSLQLLARQRGNLQNEQGKGKANVFTCQRARHSLMATWKSHYGRFAVFWEARGPMHLTSQGMMLTAKLSPGLAQLQGEHQSVLVVMKTWTSRTSRGLVRTSRKGEPLWYSCWWCFLLTSFTRHYGKVSQWRHCLGDSKNAPPQQKPPEEDYNHEAQGRMPYLPSCIQYLD